MRFFFDRCISVHLARMLDAYDRDHAILHQDDDSRFEQITPDVELIRIVSADEPKPVFITADVKQRRRADERQALATSGMTVVFIRAGFHALDFHTQAVKLLSVWPELVTACERCREPTAFEITPKMSKLDRLCLTKDLARR